MEYKEWKNAIADCLVQYGMTPEIAYEKAGSVRGKYLEKNNHPSPNKMAYEIYSRISPLEREWMRRDRLKQLYAQNKRNVKNHIYDRKNTL